MAGFTYEGDLAEASRWRPFGETMLYKIKSIANGRCVKINHTPDENTTIMVQCNPDTVFVRTGAIIDVVIRSDSNVYIIRERFPGPNDSDQTRIEVVPFPVGKGVGFAFSWTDYKTLACSVFDVGYTSLLIKGIEYVMPVDTNDYRVVGVALISDSEGFYAVISNAILNAYAMREVKLFHFKVGLDEYGDSAFLLNTLIFTTTADPFVGMVMSRQGSGVEAILAKNFNPNGGTTLGASKITIAKAYLSWYATESALPDVGLYTTSTSRTNTNSTTTEWLPYVPGGRTYERTLANASETISTSGAGISIARCWLTDTFATPPVYPALNYSFTRSVSMTQEIDTYVGQTTSTYARTDSTAQYGSAGLVKPKLGFFYPDASAPITRTDSLTNSATQLPDVDPTLYASPPDMIQCLGTTQGSGTSTVSSTWSIRTFQFADAQVRVDMHQQFTESGSSTVVKSTQAVPGGCPTNPETRTTTGNKTETNTYVLRVGATEVYSEPYTSVTSATSAFARLTETPAPAGSSNYTVTGSPGASILPAMGTGYVTNGKLYVVKVGQKLVVLKVKGKQVQPDVIAFITATNPNTLKMALHKS